MEQMKRSPSAFILFFFSFPLLAEEGLATYYTVKSCQREGTSGVHIANGERFDESALTCARRSRKWNALWKVTSIETKKSIIVRQNDFGPGKKPTKRGVIIDLTPAGFKALGAKPKQGSIKVRVEPYKDGLKKGVKNEH